MTRLSLYIAIIAPCFVGCSLQAQSKGVGFSTERPSVQSTEKKTAGKTEENAPPRLDDIQKKAEALGVYSQSSLSHMLGEGDVIEIKVYQEEELTTKTRVDSEGKVTMPLLGAIKVGGQSVEKAQQLIHDLLERDYLRSPQVSMTLIEFAKQRFSVLGEVNQPGFFMIPEGETMNVLQAIAQAGGFTPYARSGEIVVKRKVNGQEETIRVDAKAMAKKKRAPSLEIQGGDAIYVNQSLF